MKTALIKPPRATPMWLVRTQRTVGRWLAYGKWLSSGKTGRTPFLAKQQFLLQLARVTGARSLIECGTFCGEMAFGLRRSFRRIDTIELSHTLAKSAAQRVQSHRHIHVHQGDSAEHLPRLLREASSPCIVWLDGHYSSGKIARGNRDFPVLLELTQIFQSAPGHWVLVDDARCFTGQHDYPTLEQVQQLCATFGRHDLRFEHDMIRIAPQSTREVPRHARSA